MKQIILNLIGIYQKYISLRSPGRCRFLPTCSAYSAQAIKDYGLLIGGGKAVWRIIRCNPLNPSRYDPPSLSKKDRNLLPDKLKSVLGFQNHHKVPRS